MLPWSKPTWNLPASSSSGVWTLKDVGSASLISHSEPLGWCWYVMLCIALCCYCILNCIVLYYCLWKRGGGVTGNSSKNIQTLQNLWLWLAAFQIWNVNTLKLTWFLIEWLDKNPWDRIRNKSLARNRGFGKKSPQAEDENNPLQEYILTRDLFVGGHYDPIPDTILQRYLY